MSEQNDVPNVEDIKERLKIDIEDIEFEEEAARGGQSDVVADLSKLGKQFAETLRNAISGSERQEFDGEVREGVRSFVDEIDKVVKGVRESEPAQRIRKEATNLDVDDLGRKARTNIAKGLRWLSDEMGKLADQANTNDTPPKSS